MICKRTAENWRLFCTARKMGFRSSYANTSHISSNDIQNVWFVHEQSKTADYFAERVKWVFGHHMPIRPIFPQMTSNCMICTWTAENWRLFCIARKMGFWSSYANTSHVSSNDIQNVWFVHERPKTGDYLAQRVKWDFGHHMPIRPRFPQMTSKMYDLYMKGRKLETILHSA